jgi:hypothetical protein
MMRKFTRGKRRNGTREGSALSSGGTMTRELESLIVAAYESGELSHPENFVLDCLMLQVITRRPERGRDVAMSGERLRELLAGAGHRTDRRALSAIIARLIEHFRIPIGTSKGSPSGYFLTITDADQESAALELWAQIRSMIRRAQILSPRTRHGREILGQLEAELADAERIADEQSYGTGTFVCHHCEYENDREELADGEAIICDGCGKSFIGWETLRFGGEHG